MRRVLWSMTSPEWLQTQTVCCKSLPMSSADEGGCEEPDS